MLLSIHDEEALSEMEQLIASLEAHQRNENYVKLKQIVPRLDQRYALGRDFITKGPEPLKKDQTYHYVHQPSDLHRAMLQVLERVDNKLPPPVAAFQGIVGREPYPVADKASEILHRLINFGITRFRALFKGARSRSELVATFLAVLELSKTRKIMIEETEEGDCTLRLATREEQALDVPQVEDDREDDGIA
jgi:segregation and condensation protein A